MADLAKIKRNVAKMASMNAPVEEIDGYISSAGSNVDEVRNFKSQSTHPKDSIGQALMRNLIGAGKDVYSEGIAPVVHGASTFAMGVPKAVAEKTGAKDIIYPEQTTLIGKANRGIMEGLGFMGGGAVNLGTRLGRKVLPNLVSKAGIAPKTTRFLGEKLGRKALRGAIQYGTAGALQVPEKAFVQPIEQTATQVGGQGALGAVLGAGGEVVGNLIVRPVSKGINKFFTTKAKGKLPVSRTIEKLTKRATNIADLRKAAVKEQAQRLPGQEAQVKSLFQAEQAPLKETEGRIDKSITRSKDIYKAKSEEAIGKSQQEIDRISQLESREAKSALQKFKTEHSKAYKGELEKIRDLDANEVRGILKSTRQDLEGKFLDANDLAPLEEKYSATAGAIGKKYKFAEFKSDYDNIMDKISAKAISPTANVQRGDLAAISLRSHVKEYAEQNIPEFLELQSKARPVLQAINNLEGKLQPGDPNLVERGSKFLQDISGKEKVNIGYDDITKMLEEGTPGYVKGVGKISTKTGQAISGAKQTQTEITDALEKRIAQLEGRRAKVLEGRKNLSENESRKLAQIDLDKVDIEKQKNQISDMLRKRTGQLEQRAEQTELLASRRKIANIIKGLGTGGLGGIGMADYIIRRRIASKFARDNSR